MILGILFVGASCSLVWTAWKIVQLKYLFLQRIIAKKLGEAKFFSSLAVEELAKYILLQKRPKKLEMLRAISGRDLCNLADIVEDKQQKNRLLLMLNGRVKKEVTDPIYLAMIIGLALKNNQYEKASAQMKNFSVIEKKTVKLRALELLYRAQIALYEGDMYGASVDASEALRIFQKKNMLFEEAMAYFVLGALYRVCGVYDAADFMLRSAKKMFALVGADNYLIETLASLGLLMEAQNRFEEADDYLQKALTAAINNEELKGFVVCQQAMSALMQNKPEEAERLVCLILNDVKAHRARSVALDVLARVCLQKQDFVNTEINAKKAAEMFFSERNFAAGFECCYLRAIALDKQNKLDEAEDVLRDLIDKEKVQKTCFFVANAYTLLGLVLLKKGQTDRAKAIFNQALKQELCVERKSGAAVDYVNLAMIARKKGDKEEAYKNLEAALENAKGDEELFAKIRSVMD